MSVDPTIPTFCIYHGGCDDGFGSAWVVRNAAGEVPVEFYAGVYQTPPPDVTGHDVLLVDFSYKRPVLEKMALSAKSITIIDHHQTAQNDLDALLGTRVAGGCTISGIFDMDKSGAILTWEWFFKDKKPPTLLRYIQDRDLWRNELDHSPAIIAWLRSHDHDFETWDVLSQILTSNAQHVIPEGTAILQCYRQQIKQAKKHAWRMRITGIDVLVTHSTMHFSEIAGELAEYEPFAATIFLAEAGTKVVFSLRSREGGMNVGEIAKRFGGGGHKQAAGFSIPLSDFDPAGI